MLPVIENPLKLQQVILIGVAIGIDVPQQFNLIQSLIKKILIVGDHLETSLFLLDEIVHFEHLGKNSAPQHTLDLVPAGQDITLGNVKLGGLFAAGFFPVEDHLQL